MPHAVKQMSPAENPSLIGTAAPGHDPAAPLFVWVAWASMFLAALTLVKWCGNPYVAYMDDWHLVAVTSGAKPATPGWLWSQHNEHRIPLPRLILLALAKLTGGDLRAGMYSNVGLMALLAFVLICVAKRLRGWTAYSDAFFPVFALSLAQHYTFTLNLTLNCALPMFLASMLLVAVIGGGGSITFGKAAVAGICLTLLPLCGSVGLPYVAAMAPWAACVGMPLALSSSAPSRRRGFVLLTSAAIAVSVTGLYYLGYEKPGYIPPSPGPWASLKTSTKLLSILIGQRLAEKWWFISGPGLLALTLISGGVSAYAWYKRPGDRGRAAAVLLFLSAFLVLALGIGHGRAGIGENIVFENNSCHYYTLLVPPLCGIYLVWEMYNIYNLGRCVQMGLFTLACAVTLTNARDGLKVERARADRMQDFEAAMRGGSTPILLAEEYEDLWGEGAESFADMLRELQRARFGPYQLLHNDPPMHDVGPDSLPRGVVDEISPRLIRGWAWDEANPNSSIKVDIYDGETKLATVTAGYPRADLQERLGSGLHAFRYSVPTRLDVADDQPHVIRVVFAGTDKDLAGSPRTLSAFLPPPAP